MQISCRSCLSHRSNQAASQDQANAPKNGLEGFRQLRSQQSLNFIDLSYCTSTSTQSTHSRSDSMTPLLRGSWFQLRIASTSGSPAWAHSLGSFLGSLPRSITAPAPCWQCQRGRASASAVYDPAANPTRPSCSLPDTPRRVRDRHLDSAAVAQAPCSPLPFWPPERAPA